ncbi:Glutaredoxin-C8 [Orbilia brochopaga]|nr:Glutaredoxin-C8 [Drechslerella brochopaga]
MTALRRVKIIGVAAFTALILLLFYGASTHHERSMEQQAYNEQIRRQKAGRHGFDTEDLDIEKQLKSQRLKDAADSAKQKANAKAPNPPSGFEPVAKQGTGGWDVTLEIDSILKRSPIIIFSKSYCQFSKKAKRLLLETYDISPAPYVVELDQHEHGSEIQDALQKQTGRRTVPNILVLGKSIGGSDDIAALERDGMLVSTVKGLAGKRVQMIKT